MRTLSFVLSVAIPTAGLLSSRVTIADAPPTGVVATEVERIIKKLAGTEEEPGGETKEKFEEFDKIEFASTLRALDKDRLASQQPDELLKQRRDEFQELRVTPVVEDKDGVFAMASFGSTVTTLNDLPSKTELDKLVAPIKDLRGVVDELRRFTSVNDIPIGKAVLELYAPKLESFERLQASCEGEIRELEDARAKGYEDLLLEVCQQLKDYAASGNDKLSQPAYDNLLRLAVYSGIADAANQFIELAAAEQSSMQASFASSLNNIELVNDVGLDQSKASFAWRGPATIALLKRIVEEQQHSMDSQKVIVDVVRNKLIGGYFKEKMKTDATEDAKAEARFEYPTLLDFVQTIEARLDPSLAGEIAKCKLELRRIRWGVSG